MTSLQTVALTPELFRGVIELERTSDGFLPHRLPAWVRAQCPDPQLLMVEAQPSGVRLAVHTEATTLELDTIPTKRVYAGMAPRPDGVYDLLVDGQLAAQGTVEGGSTMTIDLATGNATIAPGEPGTLRFSGLSPGAKDLEIWLPHDEQTEVVGLRSDSPVTPVDDSARPVWLHHGSSISHGSNATSPTSTWPAIAAGLTGSHLVNLGLGGSALLDPFLARVLRDTPADVISLELGINVVNTDLMRLRALGPAVHGLLDTLREGHPSTPLVVISPILCPIHEETPGPSAPDLEALGRGELRFLAAGDPAEVATGKLTLRVIREELQRIVVQRSTADPHLHYLDGRSLYGDEDTARLPLPDALHPDTPTHRLIGERFAQLMPASPRRT